MKFIRKLFKKSQIERLKRKKLAKRKAIEAADAIRKQTIINDPDNWIYISGQSYLYYSNEREDNRTIIDAVAQHYKNNPIE